MPEGRLLILSVSVKMLPWLIFELVLSCWVLTWEWLPASKQEKCLVFLSVPSQRDSIECMLISSSLVASQQSVNLAICLQHHQAHHLRIFLWTVMSWMTCIPKIWLFYIWEIIISEFRLQSPAIETSIYSAGGKENITAEIWELRGMQTCKQTRFLGEDVKGFVFVLEVTNNPKAMINLLSLLATYMVVPFAV